MEGDHKTPPEHVSPAQLGGALDERLDRAQGELEALHDELLQAVSDRARMAAQLDAAADLERFERRRFESLVAERDQLKRELVDACGRLDATLGEAETRRLAAERLGVQIERLEMVSAAQREWLAERDSVYASDRERFADDRRLLREELDRLRAQQGDLLDRADAATRDREHLAAQHAAVERELDRSRNKVAGVERELEHSRASEAELQSELQRSRDSIAETEGEFERSRTSAVELQQVAREGKALAERLTTSLEGLREERAVLERRLGEVAGARDAALQSAAQMDGRLHAAEQRAERVEGELQAAVERASKLEVELRVAEERADRLEAELRAEADELQAAARLSAALQGELAAARQRIMGLEDEVASAGERVRALDIKLGAVAGHAERLARDLEAAHARAAELERAASRLQADVERSAGERAALAVAEERAREAAQQASEDAAQARASAATTQDGLLRQLEKVTAEHAAVTTQLAVLRADLERARTDAEAAQRRSREFDLARETAERHLHDAHLEQRQLLQRLALVDAALSARSREFDATRRSLWQRARRALELSASTARRRTVVIVAMLVVMAAAGAGIVGLAWSRAGELGAAGLLVIGAVIGVRSVRHAARAVPPLKALVPPSTPIMLPTLAPGPATPAPAGRTTVSGPRAAKVIRPTVTRLVPAPAQAMAGTERLSWTANAASDGLSSLRVAGVLDEMSQACFEPECRLYCDFGLHDWEERLEAVQPHALLVESAWSGNSGGWQYGVASYEHPDYRGLPYLRGLVQWCRKRGIPTVFWNKEDPVHYERFWEAAALFDHVFTTDANRIPAYEALEGPVKRTVHVLPFAAQPRLHNPVPVVARRRLEPVFAGAYYRKRHADRQVRLDRLLDAARPFGLIIYDRTYGSKSDEFGFPERFLAHVKGRLPYDHVIDIYKSHRVMLNVNSVTDSPTMFSRRVFELLACGTAVVSTESVGIRAMFGDVVPIVETIEDATVVLERMLHDDEHFHAVTSRGRRRVLREHTYRHRLRTIAEVAGFDLPPDRGVGVTAVVLGDEGARLEPLLEAIGDQTSLPEEVVVGVLDGVAELRSLGDVPVRTVSQEPGRSAQDRLRELAALAATEWIAPFADGRSYASEHLRDALGCVPFAAADAIGVADGPDQGTEHCWVRALDPWTAIVRRDVVARTGWATTVEETHALFARGVRLFAGERAASAPSNRFARAGAGRRVEFRVQQS